jgi:hypothetical protein
VDRRACIGVWAGPARRIPSGGLTTVAEAGDEGQRERTAVYDGWWRCETLEDGEEQERLVESYAERTPGMVEARELLKMVRRSIEHHGGAL